MDHLKNNPEKSPHVFATMDKPVFFSYIQRNNEICRVYHALIVVLKGIVARSTFEQQRTHITINFPRFIGRTQVFHEFICSLCSLTLSIKKKQLIIEFDTSTDVMAIVGEANYKQAIRDAYRLTMWECTSFDIEDSLIVNVNKLNHSRYFKRMVKQEGNVHTTIAIEPPFIG